MRKILFHQVEKGLHVPFGKVVSENEVRGDFNLFLSLVDFQNPSKRPFDGFRANALPQLIERPRIPRFKPYIDVRPEG